VKKFFVEQERSRECPKKGRKGETFCANYKSEKAPRRQKGCKKPRRCNTDMGGGGGGGGGGVKLKGEQGGVPINGPVCRGGKRSNRLKPTVGQRWRKNGPELGGMGGSV